MNWEEVAASRRGTGASGRSSVKEKAEWNPFTPSVICYRDEAPDLGSEASVSLVIGHSQTHCRGEGLGPSWMRESVPGVGGEACPEAQEAGAALGPGPSDAYLRPFR